MEFLYVGPHEWTVYNDFYCSGEVGKIMISLTTCKSDEFTCNDGLCVEIDDRSHIVKKNNREIMILKNFIELNS